MITHYITKAAMDALIAHGSSAGREVQSGIFEIYLDEDVNERIMALVDPTAEDEIEAVSAAILQVTSRQFGNA